MMKNVSIKNPSAQFRAGGRTYFFKIKEDARGDKYLKISESITNNVEDGQITILKQDLPAFKQTFNAIYQQVFPQVVQNYSMSKIRERHKNAYKKWSENEEEYMLILQAEGCSVQEISTKMGRQIGSIKSRLRKFNLL